MLLAHISPVFMAGLLYIGARLGIDIKDLENFITHWGALNAVDISVRIKSPLVFPREPF
jgi:hypothetical protein